MTSENVGTRDRYAYFLIRDGVAIWGYERDPTGHPEAPVHWHDKNDGDERHPCERVSFVTVIEMARAEIADVLSGKRPTRPPTDYLKP